MITKSAAIAVLVPLCFAPAAILAHGSQVRLQAFDGIASKAERLERPLVKAALSELAALALEARTAPPSNEVPTPVGLGHAERRERGTGPSAAGRGCADWRPLNAGPTSRAANVGQVRACEEAPSLPVPTTLAARAAMPDGRPRAHARSMSFVVDMRAPF